MAKLYNLARMTTATTGTGTITLGSAATGFLSFADAGVANGETITYAIEDGTNREVGRGVYTSSGTTLTRTVLKSTNSNSAINLSGTAQVFITVAAEDVIEPNGALGTPSSGTLTNCTGLPISGLATSTTDYVPAAGLAFPATQAASSNANTLDDYEEGTWTPVVEGSSTAGSGSYSTQTGLYTKIGRMVYYFGRTIYTGHTGTGNLYITGLPFTVNGTVPCMLRVSTLVFPNPTIQGIAANGTTRLQFETVTDGAAASTLAIDSAADLNCMGFYFV